MNDAAARPSLSEWADVFEAATGHCVQCSSCDSTFFYTSKHTCPFCENLQDKEKTVLLKEYRYIPIDLLCEGLGDDIPKSLIQKECWTKTGNAMVLSTTSLELRTLQLGASLYKEAALLCTIQLQADGLWIEPSGITPISLQSASDKKVVTLERKQRLKSENRFGISFWLHLGSIESEHIVWQFIW